MRRLFAIVFLLGLGFTIPASVEAGKWAKGLYAKSITDVLRVYSNRYIKKGGKKGRPMLGLGAVGDFSGDGLPEIVYGGPLLDIATGDELHTSSKTFVIRRSAKGKYSLYTPMMNRMPYSNYSREAVIADFNGDGRNDLFITDHGFHSDTGAQNALVLSRGRRGFLNAAKRLPKIIDFSHGVGAGDVDGDGDIDLFIAQSSYEGSSHHYFLENRKGKFIRVPNGKWMDESLSKIILDPAIPNGGIDRLNGAGIEDIDGDGQIDLLLISSIGESLHNPRIVFGKKGKFKEANVVEFPPDRYFKNTSIIPTFTVVDLDGNGLKDLILAYQSSASGTFEGMSFQVMLQTKPRVFKDKTKRYFPNAPYKKGGWCYDIYLVDLNNDEREDLVCGSIYEYRNGEPPKIFLQQKNKQFKPVRPSDIVGRNRNFLVGLRAIDIDGDGDIELVGYKLNTMSNATAGFTVQVVELTTKKVKIKFIDKTATSQSATSSVRLIVDKSGRRIYTDQPERYSE